MNGIDFIPVKPMMARCQKVLPLVYDDSLSYYEVLCKVQKKTNDLIHNVNEFFEWATQHESDYDALVKRVARVENEIDTFEYQIQLYISLSFSLISGRINKLNWSVEKALTTPKKE